MYFLLWAVIFKKASAYSSIENTRLTWHVYTSNMEFKVPIQTFLEYGNMIKRASRPTRFQLRTIICMLELGKHAAEHILKTNERQTRCLICTYMMISVLWHNFFNNTLGYDQRLCTIFRQQTWGINMWSSRKWNVCD